MKLFISWSGTRSRAIAEALCNWIPDVIQACEPWISSKDIDPGARWSSDLAKELELTKFGIICLTSENLKSRWIHFEAGALSKILDDKTRVCPYLLELEPTDIDGPLVQFQAIRANEDDTLKLIYAINKAMGDEALSGERLNRAFIRNWPGLKSELKAISESDSADKEPKRSDRDLIEEILRTVRYQSKQQMLLDDEDPIIIPVSSNIETEYLKDCTGLVHGVCSGIYKELKDHKIEVSLGEIEEKLNEDLLKGMPVGLAIGDVRVHFFTDAGLKPPRCSLVFAPSTP
jgi:hypothetical protein